MFRVSIVEVFFINSKQLLLLSVTPTEKNTKCPRKKYSYNCHSARRPYKLEKQPPEMFCQKCVLRNFAKFTGKHLSHSLFLNKVAGYPAGAQVFSCEFCEVSKSTFWYRRPPVPTSRTSETATWKCSVKQLLWKIRVNFLEKICGSMSFLIFWTYVFSRNFLKHFRTAILKNSSGRLFWKLYGKFVVTVVFSTETAIHRSCETSFLETHISRVY